jgi:hypothetical protein
VDVKLYVNGVLRRHLRGHDIGRLSFGPVSLKRFTIRIVATESNGNKVVMTRALPAMPDAHPAALRLFPPRSA